MTHNKNTQFIVIATFIGISIGLGVTLFGNIHIQDKETPVHLNNTVATQPEIKNNRKINEPHTVKPAQQDLDKNLFFEKEAKARLIQISKSFSEDIKFPDNSKPIRNKQELDKYTPNKSVPAARSTNIKDPNSPRITVTTLKHQYFSHEIIQALASVSNIKLGDSIKVSARLVANGQTLLQGKVSPSPTIEGGYDISFDKPSDNLAAYPSIRVVANFSINQQPYEIGTPIQYQTAIAEIDHVAQAFVNQSYLHIPVYINTTVTGYHLISANLYNRNTQQALVHLSEQKHLSTLNDFIELKAHISALSYMGHEGPYELRDLSLTRMPSKPDYLTQYGLVAKDRFAVNGYPFSDYEQEDYQNSDAQERLDFLNQLGGQPTP
jgi:hypothetical protein